VIDPQHYEQAKKPVAPVFANWPQSPPKPVAASTAELQRLRTSKKANARPAAAPEPEHTTQLAQRELFSFKGANEA